MSVVIPSRLAERKQQGTWALRRHEQKALGIPIGSIKLGRDQFREEFVAPVKA